MTQNHHPLPTKDSNRGAARIFVLSLGARVTPAQGSVKPTAGFTKNKVPSFRPSGSPRGAFVAPRDLQPLS
jgi:hypothetical protein